MKKISFVLVLCILLGLISGCDSTPEELKGTEQYVLDCGATLTAGAGMKEVEADGFTTALLGEHAYIFLLDDNKIASGMSNMTLEEYAQLVQMGNDLKDDFFVDACGNLAAEYNREVDGEMAYYYTTVHESGSSFWLCHMACKEEDRDQYKENFAQWSASLKVRDTELKLPDITEKTYTLDCGVQFTGPDGMRLGQKEGYAALLTDNLMIVSFFAEEKPDGWTLTDYAKAVEKANELEALTENERGVLAAEYTWESPEGSNYWYYLTVFETEENFWMCQFMGPESMKERYEPYLPAWSASIKSAS